MNDIDDPVAPDMIQRSVSDTPVLDTPVLDTPVIDSSVIDTAVADPPTLQAVTSELVEKVIAMDMQGLAGVAANDLAPQLLWAALGLAVIFLGYLVASMAARMVSRPICRRVDETLGKFAGRLVFYLILSGVTASVLSKLGAPLGGLAAMLAAAGFAIGLAFQGTLSNFAAGVLMLVFRPFKVGDMINAAGVLGRVNEIDLFTTTLDTPDNRRIIVPNSSISGSTIENISYHKDRRVEVLVGVAYKSDLDATRTALTAAALSLATQTVQGEGRGHQVILAGLGASSVDWKVRVWVAAKDYWPMTEALIGAVKRQLDAAAITIPFPQMDVHVNRIDDAQEIHRDRRIRPMRRDPIDEETYRRAA